MKVNVLGYYGGYPYNGHGTSAYLVSEDDYNLLLDCGSGALLSLEKVIEPLQLDSVLLTHYHQDHIADVGVLQYYYQLKSGLKKHDPLMIYGHQEDEENFKNLTFSNFTKGVAFDPTKRLDLGPFEITFCRTIHPVVAFAVRIKSKVTGKVLTYTADSRYFKELTDFVKDSDLLIADTNFAADKNGDLWHMTSTQSADLARDGQVKKLLLSHLPQEISHEQILKEAKEEAPKINILLASKIKEIEV
ncbi:MBL fold metallo-hydrolase [Xylocopilactobacillus apis]|uniref:MBL fold metallo-hydrolase n=1 Tax=Xylocopilactobacillus apis TaxID=2932183 RepID=A0AAU9D034_9LACO|nr:MBL fold metallo-hydrolase [Xylocopilactobacillus apis]BDR55871.1 MBL fold metallo-hydrolase [Xylocopilactobacillus apis]